MAIDEVSYPDAQDLASSQKSFYPLSIPVSHWQLRHYLSHPDPDTLYYASANDVYYLNTKTRKRKHIAVLPFEARCTAAGHGYVCVGGEHDGHFAVIKLSESVRPAEIDSAVSLDYWQGLSAPYAAHVTLERIGEHIVNSISIHKIHDEEAHLYDIVAVLTNNDHTVRVYSLTHGLETNVLKASEPLNHATISPDGRTLAAVGDVNTLHFFTRYMQCDPPQIPKPHNRLSMSSAGWRRSGSHKLYVPGGHTQRGYFTTAWSPRGHLLAVGSEAGYITIFGMETSIDSNAEFTEVERLVTIPSTRPDLLAQTCPGAVRSMLFAPDPWDLLIWAEDQGRICIGDLRTGLRTKQVIELDPNDESLLRHDVELLTPEDDICENRRSQVLEAEYQRLQAQDNDSTRARFGGEAEARFAEGARPTAAARYREHSSARTRPYSRFPSRFADRPTWSNYNDPMGLTSDESQILESLRTTRQREEAQADGELPRSINYTSSSLFDHTVRRDDSSRSGDGSRYTNFPYLSRRVDRYTSGQATSQRDSTRHDYALPPLTSQHPLDGVQTRYRIRQMLDDPLWSVRESSSTNPSRVPRPIPPHAMRGPRPSSTAHEQDQEDEEQPWRTVMDAMDASSTMDLARGPLFEATSTTPPDTLPPPGTVLSDPADRSIPTTTDEHVRALATQRDRLRNLQRHLASTSDLARSTPGTNEGLTSRYELLRDVARDRDAQAQAVGFEAGWELLRMRSLRRGGTGMGAASGAEIGVRTAGLAVSTDGRRVWAATEDGIFEVGIRVKERMRAPAVEMR